MTAGDDRTTTTWERGAWLATAALFGATGLRTRRRAQRLQVLDDVTDDVAVEGELLVARGVQVGDDVRRAAAAHAGRLGLDGVDLVPADLPVERALALLRAADPAAYREAAGRAPAGGCQAVYASAALAHRAGLADLVRRARSRIAETC